MIDEFITNPSSNVFCLKSLPEEVVAVLFAMYSRSTKSLRETLASMITATKASERNTLRQELIRQGASEEDLVALEKFDLFGIANGKASAFHDRFVLGYGHASVAEHAVLHIAIEKCSIYAAKVFEEARLASFTEKSTRYVKFTKDSILSAETLHIPAEYADAYQRNAEFLMDAYHRCLEETQAHLVATVLRPEGLTDAQWKNTIYTKSFDMCRGLIPLATGTSVGMTINARTLANSLCKWLHHELGEVRDIAQKILEEASKVVPTLLKHATEKPIAVSSLAKVRALIGDYTIARCRRGAWQTNSSMEYNDRTIALADAILDEATGVWNSLGHDRDTAEEIVGVYLADHTLHQQPGRALEVIHFGFHVLMDFGAWRDLQRHRMLTALNFPVPEFGDGYYTPEGFSREITEFYDDVIEQAERRWKALPNSPWRIYDVPMAVNVRWTIYGNLREFFYLCERRSGKEGHPSYREIVQEIARSIVGDMPVLEKFWHVDFNDYAFAR